MVDGVIQETRPIAFFEGELLVKEIRSDLEFQQAFRLRHRVFAEKLKWVPQMKDQLESDVYDAWSTSIGIFSDERLLGMVRMTSAPFPFMLESEFSGCLIGSHRVRKALDTAEITRLAVDPAIADRRLSAKLMRTIFKGMYHWTLANNIRYTYLVVENRLLRVVQRIGWPCHAIGAPVALPPANVLSVGALLDLDEFRSAAAFTRPDMLEWLHSTEPARTGIGTHA